MNNLFGLARRLPTNNVQTNPVANAPGKTFEELAKEQEQRELQKIVQLQEEEIKRQEQEKIREERRKMMMSGLAQKR